MTTQTRLVRGKVSLLELAEYLTFHRPARSSMAVEITLDLSIFHLAADNPSDPVRLVERRVIVDPKV
jgi:hypothetical protein